MRITIWTDGACSGNPGPGGWCAVIAMHDGVSEEDIAMYAQYVIQEKNMPGVKTKYLGPGKIAALRVLFGREERTTNNRMEMVGIIEALKSFKRPTSVRVVTDSIYAMRVLNGSWKAKKNFDLLDAWREASRDFVVSWEHVNGHAGHAVNEFCDKVARSAI